MFEQNTYRDDGDSDCVNLVKYSMYSRNGARQTLQLTFSISGEHALLNMRIIILE
jgi:hypothetical protein